MTIGIIGFGRFGQFIAGVLKAYGDVMVTDVRASVKKAAAVLDVSFVSFEKAARADWVILSVPISKTESTIQQLAQCVRPGALVMDTCSVKVLPCQWLEKYLPPGVELLGSHPMFGPDSGKHGLYGLQLVLCPLRASQLKYDMVQRIFQELGAVVLKMTPVAHDKNSATTLALVHFLGRALYRMGVRDVQPSTKGFERLLAIYTSVNNDTMELFRDMHRYNPFAAQVRSSFLQSAAELEADIDDFDSLDSITAVRDRIQVVDQLIVQLLSRRVRLAARLAPLKKNMGKPVRDPKREKALLALLAKYMMKPLTRKDLQNIYGEIFAASRKAQHS